MFLSIFIAKILSVIYLAAGIGALSGQTSYEKLADDFERSPGLTFLTGFITVVLGMFMVHFHNIWVCQWVVLITLIGWLATIKGILLLAYPNIIKTFKGRYKNARTWGMLQLTFGLVFGYFAFFG